MEDRSLPTASCKVCGRVTVAELNNLAKSSKKQSVPFFLLLKLRQLHCAILQPQKWRIGAYQLPAAKYGMESRSQS